MADRNKPLTRAQVLEMTGMPAKTFDERSASAKAPQQDATWDKNANRLAPSEGGGVSETFKRADASAVPLQAPVGAMAASANAGMTLSSALENSGKDNSALNGLWKDREAKAGLSGPN